MASLLNRLSVWSTRYFAFIVLGAALLATAREEAFRFFLPHIPLLLGLVMFGMGATLQLEDVRDALRHPRWIVLGALLQFTIMPFLAWGLASLFQLKPELAAGLVLLGSCPGGTASNLITFIARGDVALSVAMTTVSTLLAPILTPILVLILAGHWLAIPTSDLFLSIVTMVLIPVGLGLLAKHLFRPAMSRMASALPFGSVLAVALIVGAITGRHAEMFWTTGWTVLAAVLLHNVLGLCLGWVIGGRIGFPERALRAAAIEVGMQNSGLATTLAQVHLHPMAALPGVIASIWQNITGPILASWWVRRDTRRDEAKD